MTATNTRKSDDRSTKSQSSAKASKARSSRKAASSSNSRDATKRSPRNRNTASDGSGLMAAVVSIVGVGVAIGAGLYASRRQWMPAANDWLDNFSNAFADDETDYENFDQTRNAGVASMRDDPGDDWDEIDDMSDASFPASDPPSTNPGTA